MYGHNVYKYAQIKMPVLKPVQNRPIAIRAYRYILFVPGFMSNVSLPPGQLSFSFKGRLD